MCLTAQVKLHIFFSSKYIVDFPYPWVLHPQIQPTVNHVLFLGSVVGWIYGCWICIWGLMMGPKYLLILVLVLENQSFPDMIGLMTVCVYTYMYYIYNILSKYIIIHYIIYTYRLYNTTFNYNIKACIYFILCNIYINYILYSILYIIYIMGFLVVGC